MRGGTVVTGMGVIAGNGVGIDEFWSAILAGKSGIARIGRFDPSGYPVTLAAEADGFVAAEHLPNRLVVQTDLMSHLALVTADMALADAGVSPKEQPEYEMSVSIASSSGGNEFGQKEIQALWNRGPQHVSVYQSIAWFYAASTGQISIRNGMRGQCGVITNEQVGGIDSVAQARRSLRGGARLALAGGTDASITPYGLVTQLPTGLLSPRTEPERAYNPFSVEACGFVPGEGGAVFTLEEEDVARARGVERVYGRVTGHASTFDPPPGSTRPKRLRAAMEAALKEARVGPEGVDVVFADAMASPEADLWEARAITELFGAHEVPVTAPKTMTGRVYAGGSALDLATAFLALRDSVIPPTTGVGARAPGCEIDLVRDTPRETPLRRALVLARGRGGFNSALVVENVSLQGESYV